MFSYKKLWSCVFAFICTSYITTVQANSWMLGFEAGYGSRTFKVNATTVNADSTGSITAASGIPLGMPIASQKGEFTDNGTIGGVLLGYEWDSHPVWVASLEFRLTFDSIADEQQWQYADTLTGANLITAYVKYDRANLIELSARVGIKGSRLWTPYLRFGGVTANDELQFATQISTGFATFAEDNMSQSDRLYGWLVGIGFELPLFQDSIVPMLRTSVVRAEYNYTKLERLNMDDVNPPINGNYTARPHMHLWKVALVFKHA